VAALRRVITAGVHRASSIKVAEAAKVIENTQRDLNIALMNELALIFHKIGIDTSEVLQAAGTKWNFLPFRPAWSAATASASIPYYLTHKAEMLGYHPQVILAGRRINDGMGWDDASVSWSRFDAVLLRSPWDYTERLAEFLRWCERVSTRTRLLNPLDVVRWNTDKHYLGELARQRVPVIESHYIEPGEKPDRFPEFDEFVVKPCVGAGSRGARRFVHAERHAAIEHARDLLSQDRSVLVQPYLRAVDEDGETALVYFDGRFSHAIRKAPLLRRGEDATRALFAPERISARKPSDAERLAAKQVLAALPFAPLAYARVDLLPSEQGPQLLELELTEPSLFFATAPGAAARFARALAQRLA
jgi:glutathione synthase/RimK-type ligase-like ATP-grasp enzyme